MRKRKNKLDCSKHISKYSMKEIDKCGPTDRHSLSEVSDKNRIVDATLQGKKHKVFSRKVRI